MIQHVTLLTVQLNQFILKQQIFLTHDPRDVVLNRVTVRQPFYSFPDVLLPPILVFNGFSHFELFSLRFPTPSHTFSYCKSLVDSRRRLGDFLYVTIIFFLTRMRELGDLWRSEVTEGSSREQAHASSDCSALHTLTPVSSPHPRVMTYSPVRPPTHTPTHTEQKQGHNREKLSDMIQYGSCFTHFDL